MKAGTERQIVADAKRNWHLVIPLLLIAGASTAALLLGFTTRNQVVRQGTPCVDLNPNPRALQPSPGCRRIALLLAKLCRDQPRSCVPLASAVVATPEGRRALRREVRDAIRIELRIQVRRRARVRARARERRNHRRGAPSPGGRPPGGAGPPAPGSSAPGTPSPGPGLPSAPTGPPGQSIDIPPIDLDGDGPLPPIDPPPVPIPLPLPLP